MKDKNFQNIGLSIRESSSEITITSLSLLLIRTQLFHRRLVALAILRFLRCSVHRNSTPTGMLNGHDLQIRQNYFSDFIRNSHIANTSAENGTDKTAHFVTALSVKCHGSVSGTTTFRMRILAILTGFRSTSGF